MAGQREQQFRTTPGTRSVPVNPAPSVHTDPARETASQIQGQGAALAALGNAFSGFFNTASKSAEDAADILHREDLIQIERENKALKTQATADRATGAGPDPRYMDRMAYAETYVNSQADDDAFKMAEDATAHMAKMPLDGSVDPQQYLSDWYKEQIGTGTGDPFYDARKFYSFTQQGETLVSRANEAIRKTVEANALNTVLESTKAAFNTSPDGLSAGKTADLHARLLHMSRGNVAVADKWFEGIVRESVTNYGQALGTLKSLSGDGGPDSWAGRNPAAYTRLSDDLFNRVHEIKTFEAGMAVQDWNQRFASLTARPDTTLAQLDEMAEEAYQIDSRHGVGPDKFRGLHEAYAAQFKKKAEVSAFKLAFKGELGTNDAGLVMQKLGKELGAMARENFEAGTLALAQEFGLSGLTESAKKHGGLPDILDSEQAAQDAVKLFTDNRAASAVLAGFPDAFKAQAGRRFMSRDPEQITRAYRFYQGLEKAYGSERVERFFDSSTTFGRFLAMKGHIGGGVDEKTAAQYFANDGEVEPLIAEAKGNFDWGKLAPGAKPAEVETAVDTAILKSLRKHTGTDGWFTGIDSSLFGKDARAVRQMMANQMRTMLKVTGAVDIDKAADLVAQQIAKDYRFIPGARNHFQMVKNPYGNHGTTLLDPLNTINGKAVYALGYVTNADGKTENTVKTFREDMREFAKAFPGLADPMTSTAFGLTVGRDSAGRNSAPLLSGDHSGENISLGLPDNNGLHPMRLPTGQPIRVMAGQRIITAHVDPIASEAAAYEADVFSDAMMGRTGALKSVTTFKPTAIPKGEAEAFKFLQDRAPPGVFYVKAGNDPATGLAFFEARYGARIKLDQKVLDEQIKQNEKKRNEASRWEAKRSAMQDENNPTHIPAGALYMFNPTGVPEVTGFGLDATWGTP